jgi:hypothetical protein
MERKHFLSSALIGASALVAAAGAGFADTTQPSQPINQSPAYDPCQPGGNRRFGEGPRAMSSPNPNAILEHADRNLGRMISMLQRDPNDYAGHKEQAIGFLQQALTEVQAALQTVSANPQSPIHSSL